MYDILQLVKYKVELSNKTKNLYSIRIKKMICIQYE